DSTLILVPVTVTDSTDHPVTDLPRSRFRLFEDNVERKLHSFHKGDGPVSVGIVFDASSSMEGQIESSVAAVRRLMRTLMPGAESFLIRFSDRPVMSVRFTHDPDEILDALRSIRPEGWTALNDPIYLAVHQMKCEERA